MVNILLPKRVDVENIVIDKTKSMREGGGILSAKVGYKTKDSDDADRLIIQTPKMRCPFGINSDEKFGDGTKWDIRLSLQGEERNEKIQQFRDCMNRINNKIIDTCVEKSDEWLNDEEIDKKMASKFFKSSIKSSKKEGFADMFRVAIPFTKDEETGEQNPRKWIEFYGEDNSLVDWKSVGRGSEVICLFEINGVWASPGTTQYGLSVKLIQLKVFKTKQLVGLQILNDDDDEIDDLEEEDSIQDEVEEEDTEQQEEVEEEEEEDDLE